MRIEKDEVVDCEFCFACPQRQLCEAGGIEHCDLYSDQISRKEA